MLFTLLEPFEKSKGYKRLNPHSFSVDSDMGKTFSHCIGMVAVVLSSPKYCIN
jgi:hypothetical protein